MTRKHRSIISGFLGLILISILIIKLIPKHNDSQWKFIKTKSLIGLFEYAYQNQNSPYFDTVTQMIVDSLKDNSDFVISTIDVIDSANNQIRLGFYLDSLFWENFCIKERNIFAIYINKYDNLLAEGEIIHSDDSLQRQIIDYISNPLDKPHLPEKRIKRIDYFGEYAVSNQFFYLRAQMIPDSLGLSTSWKGLFQTFNLILGSYEILRDEISKAKFNQHFIDLELDEQIAVSKIFRIRIWIFLDYAFVPPPPPPPMPHDDFFIEDFEIEIDLDE